MIYKDPKTCLDGLCFIVLVIRSSCLFSCELFVSSQWEFSFISYFKIMF